MSVNVDYYIFARIKPHACQWILWWPSMCLLNLAIQDVASMAAKTCSLGSLCKQYFILLSAVQSIKPHACLLPVWIPYLVAQYVP